MIVLCSVIWRIGTRLVRYTMICATLSAVRYITLNINSLSKESISHFAIFLMPNIIQVQINNDFW